MCRRASSRRQEIFSKSFGTHMAEMFRVGTREGIRICSHCYLAELFDEGSRGLEFIRSRDVGGSGSIFGKLHTYPMNIGGLCPTSTIQPRHDLEM